MLANPPVEKIRAILGNCRSIAVVGLSPKPTRPSYQVGQYLLAAGYTVIPINPGHDELLGLPCYPDLASVPGPVDVVDIFRRAEYVLPLVTDAIAKNVTTVWMQEGVVNTEAAALAEKNGIMVIMDRCIKVDHQQYMD